MNKAIAAKSTVQIDDEFIRVTRSGFPVGTETGNHTHEFDYVVIPVSDGTLTAQTAEGEFENQLILGESYQGLSNTTHNVVNKSDRERSFVEVELKR